MFSHVLNPVGVGPNHHLWTTQQVTFTAIAQARARIADRIDVVTVSYPEDHAIIPASFRQLPDLQSSILDVAEFDRKRKLPFLADILGTAHRHCDSDYLIFSNVDIIPAPSFYEFVAAKVGDGEQAFTINRRTVDAVDDPLADLSALTSQRGRPHPGHDCFVFRRDLVASFDLGRVVVGVPWVGFTLLLNLATTSGVTVLADEFQTFHTGDDRAWLSGDDRQYRDFHTLEAAGVMDRVLTRNPAPRAHPYIAAHVNLASRQRGTTGFAPPAPQPSPPIPKVFSISSGRAGSEYLQTVLGSADGVLAFHEPEPTMSGRALTEAMATGRAPVELTNYKLDTIDEATKALPPGWTYVETNHMFIKTFADAAIERWSDHIAVVHMRRNLVDVLTSFTRLGYFSDRNRAWPHWMHRVPSALSLLEPPAPFEEMDPIDRSIAYLLDIEEQAAAFRVRHPHVTVVETSLEALQNHDEVDRVLTAFGLSPTPRTRSVTGHRVNARTHVKQAIGMDVERSQCRARLEQFAERVGSVTAQTRAEQSLAVS